MSPTRHFKFIVEYDGTGFSGWQIQKAKQRTVQGEIQAALKKIFRKSVRVSGSGRTDTGVHALGQIGAFEVDTNLNVLAIQRALNFYLPKDIVILGLSQTKAQFHPRFSVKTKIYRYQILNRECRTALERNFCWHVPQPVDLNEMKKEAKGLIGKNDFRGFMSSDTSHDGTAKDTVRSIKRLDIRRKGKDIVIEIEADGFLYKMARNIVGALIAVGVGKLPKGTITKILKGRNRSLAPAPAPARGLYLAQVKY